MIRHSLGIQIQNKLAAEEAAIPTTGSTSKNKSIKLNLVGSNVPYNQVGIALAFERRFEEMKEQMQLAVKLKTELISVLKSTPAEAVLQKAEALSRRLAELEVIIKNSHEGLSKLQPSASKLTILFAYFVLLVWNDRSQAKRLASKAQLLFQSGASESRSGSSQRSKAILRATTMKKQQLKHKQNSAAHTISDIDKVGDVPLKGFVAISLEEEAFGEIQEIDQYCQNMLGLSREQLLNKQLSTVLPADVATQHNTYLREFGKRPTSHVIDRKWVRFFVGKDASLIPVNLTVKFYLGLNRGAYLVGSVEEYVHAKRSDYRSRLRYFLSFNCRTGDIGYVCKNSMKQLGFL